MGKAAVFVKNQVGRMSLRVRRGTEGDGGGRMEEGQREDRGEAPRKTAWNGGNEGRRVSLRA